MSDDGQDNPIYTLTNEEFTLPQLNRKRSSVLHKLNNFVNFLKGVQDAHKEGEHISQPCFIELETRIDKMSQLSQEFEDIQTNIEYLCSDDELCNEYKQRDDFTNLLESTVASGKYILNSNIKNSDNNSVVSDNSIISNLQSIKLPTIELPKFNGNYNNWLQFKDTFESLIHNNSAITKIQKYHYLRATLQGDALKLIESIEFSTENYSTAWELLYNRYNNSRLLVHNHIKSIFEIETINKESSNSLRNLNDSIFKHLRALESLDQPVSDWDTLLIYIISSKLDKNTGREWEKHKSKDEFPKISDLKEFLKSRADWLETIENSSKSVHKDSRYVSKQISCVSSNQKACNYCKKEHLIYYCEDFLKLSIPERIKSAGDLKLCKNCLCLGHYVQTCKQGPCKKCKGRHNSLLHLDQATTTALTNYCGIDETLLSTITCFVKDSNNKSHAVRCLLDNASQSHFISEKLCKKLKVKQFPTNISVSGVNRTQTYLNKKCEINISATSYNFTSQLSCFIVPCVTSNLPLSKFNISSWNIPTNIHLSDKTFNIPGEIDILIGAGLFWDILLPDQISLGKHLPVLQNTKFGWIVAGQLPRQTSTVKCHFVQFSDLNFDLSKFWEVEQPNQLDLLSPDDEACENHFLANYSRDSEGRFVVKIPLKHSKKNLGESKSSSIKRFCQLEKKFRSNSQFQLQYSKFIHEYIGMGHMSLLNNNDNPLSYFLPHHGVLREESATTKLRVVFNGSFKTSSGWSLNDLQYVGPNVQNDIFSILLRFRQHSIVICADIEKMYRQILVHPEDRHLQQIVWRDNVEDDISTYQLNTVTYGTASAPYLAIRCLRQLASDNAMQFENASSIIVHDMYVDDLITGFESEGDAIVTCKQISEILQSGCFPLRKWVSNNLNVLSHFHNDADPLSTINLGDHAQSKALGIRWSSKSDVLFYQVSELQVDTILSKRCLLSNISQLFDPLGILGPTLIIAKIIIQELWLLKLNWDDPLPEQLQNKWLHFKDQLHILNSLQIDRHAICKNPVKVELHGFCDSSQKAYAACIYLKSYDFHGNTAIHLLCAKTKVAPLKVLTIPRLELCSALLLSRLCKTVSDSLTIKFQTYLWSDSQIVLSWITTDSKLLQTFVQNRVQEIQNLTSFAQWNYVRSKQNPADLASRGVFPNQLVDSQLWWNGPSWLHNQSEYELDSKFIKLASVPELRKVAGTTICIPTFSSIFNKFSSLTKLKRIFAYCLRFILNSRLPKDKRQLGELTVNELNKGLHYLIKLSQQESFSNEIDLIKSGKNKKHKLQKLSPFIDSDNLLRVGGRLQNSDLCFDNKHPILLSGSHHLTRLIFEHEHLALMHAGPQLLLATVRQRYWATSGMNVAKKITRSCIRCFKFKPTCVKPMMGNLPRERVTVTSPFSVCGIDYAGPFILRDRKGRNFKQIKGYVCLFICLSSKAVHLELVTDLSTETFIACLRRFSSRRGKPNHIYSDNATNFVGASNELKILQDFLDNSKNDIERACTKENISWHFIPPNSPHFGGLWESGVKSIKHHLYRVSYNLKLTYEEFNTVIVQIEGILNSRPIYPLSSDPNDFQPLTPSHLLIGKSLTTPPDPSVLELPMNQLTRFQLIQQIVQSFWTRWSKQYLSTLQQRSKWREDTPNLQLDSLVLIKNDNLPPCKWSLGRIVHLHPGDDGVVRVATVKTERGAYKRAVSRLCPIPVPENEQTITTV